MYYIYILRSIKDYRTYVGFCKNVAKRIKEHNSGKVRSTTTRRPLEILYIEEVATIGEAKGREKYWKSGGGRRKLKHYFKEGFPPIQDF